jgi:hypothetical protein
MGLRYVLQQLFSKKHKIANISTTIKAWQKLSTDLESLKLQKKIDISLTEFKNNQILLYKISHGFLLTAKLERASLNST